jgi:hypothetical protein
MQGIHEQVLKTRQDHSAAVLNDLSRENARQQAQLLRRESEPLGKAVANHECRLIYGIYDMETGAVALSDLD